MQLNDTLDKNLARLATTVIFSWDKKAVGVLWAHALSVCGRPVRLWDYSWSLITWPKPISCLILQLVVKLSCLGQDVIYYYSSIVVSFDKSIFVLLYNGSLSVCTVLEVEVYANKVSASLKTLIHYLIRIQLENNKRFDSGCILFKLRRSRNYFYSGAEMISE